jgi:hypothetical protein
MSRRFGIIVSVLAVTLLFVAIPPKALADGINENFDELTPTLNATNLGAFTVTAGSVDVVGGALFGSLCAAPTSGNCVDLNGTTGQLGQISSANLTLTPGTYVLSFDLIGSQRGVTTTTLVTLGSLYNQAFVLGSSDVTSGIVNDTFTVGSTTVVPLVFKSTASGNPNQGALLDNVQLTTVPEPGTLSLLAIGLAGLFLGRKRAIAK